MTVPPALRQKGVVAMLHPDRLRGKNGVEGSTEVGCTATGGLVLRISGGLLGTARIVEVAAGDLEVDDHEADGLLIRGGIVVELVIRADPASAVHTVLTARRRGTPARWGPGPEWREVGTGQVSAMTLDPQDPRKPPKLVPVGKPRASVSVWRTADGATRIDGQSRVVELAADRVRAVSSGGPKGTYVLHALQPGPDGWVTGFRAALGDVEWLTTGTPPDAQAAGLIACTLGDADAEAAFAIRAGGVLHLFDADGDPVGRIPLTTAQFAWRDRLLIVGPEVRLVGSVDEPVGRWLVSGTSEDPDLVEVLSGAPAGAARLLVANGQLRLDGSPAFDRSIADLDPGDVGVSPDGTVSRLRIGDLVVRGSPSTVAHLRELALANTGRDVLARADLDELFALWHAGRTDRWLWLLFGAVFVTDLLLDEARRVPAEPGEDTDHHQRRRIVAETLIVAEQARAVRLRLGAAPVALPYALVDEEVEWLAAIGGSLEDDDRTDLVDRLRSQLRTSFGHLGFALADVERAVTKLDSVHHPELSGGNAGVWGRVGLGAAMMLLNPVSGTMTIASAVVGRVTDYVTKDGTARQLVDRFGPQCRTSWDLLVDVTAIAAAETGSWLTGLWREHAERDRATGGESAKAALIARILADRAGRAVPLDGPSATTVGDVIDRIRARSVTGPRELIERMTGRGRITATDDV